MVRQAARIFLLAVLVLAHGVLRSGVGPAHAAPTTSNSTSAATNTSSNTSTLSCADERSTLSTRVIQCFARNFNQTRNNTVANTVLNNCFKNSGQELKVITALMPNETQELMAPLLGSFSLSSGLTVQAKYKPFEDLYQELRYSVQANVSGTDLNLFVQSSTYLPEMSALGLLVDLQSFRAVDNGTWAANWLDVHPLFRQSLSIANGLVVSVPLTAYVPFMYYRTDVFAALNLAVPATWDEVVAVATVLNATDWDPSVSQKIAICFPKPLRSDLGVAGNGSYLLVSILGSMVQYMGRSQGLLFDPGTMQPLVNTAAMARALTLYQQLAALMPDTSPSGGTSSDFSADVPSSMLTGQCALGFRWTDVIKASALSSSLKGNLGVSILPGSTQVWDRNASAWVDCDPSVCPNADEVDRPDPNDPTGETNITLYVNRVSYGGVGGTAAFLHPRSNAGLWEAGYQAMAYLGLQMLDTQWLKPSVPFGPMKSKQLTPAAASSWDDAYNASDVIAFLTAAAVVVNHPHTMIDLRLPAASQIHLIMDDAARNAETFAVGDLTGLTGVMNQTYFSLQSIVTSFNLGGTATFQSIYQAGIGYIPQAVPNPSPPPTDGTIAPSIGFNDALEAKSRRTLQLTIGLSTSIGALLLLCFAALLIMQRRGKLRNRGMLGRIVPPGLGQLTSLLVTDVQASTQLWDVLDAGVMEHSIAVSFAVLRKVATTYGGHESSTEGDSIILGFHSPLVAIRAALDSQEALLDADWPTELLAHPLCAPQYALPHGLFDEAVQASPLSSTLPSFPLMIASAPSATSTEHPIWRFGSHATTQGRTTSLQHQLMNLCCGCTSGLARSPSQPMPSPSSFQETSPSVVYDRLSDIMGGRHSVPLEELVPEAATAPSMTVGEFLGGFVVIEDRVPVLSSGGKAGAGISSQLLYRGLRIRMGIHTGLDDASCLVSNPRTGRLQYAGKALAVTTSVCSAGHGGMVLLSGDTFSMVSKIPYDILLVSMGDHRLLDLDEVTSLYAVYSQSLTYRACSMQQLRNTQQLSPGAIDAPYGRATVCFMHVVGLSALNAWSASLTQAALDTYQHLAAAEMDRFGGYLVNSNGGMVLAAFKEQAHAIRWALSTIHLCLEADWDPDLLTHELAEEVVVCNNSIEVDGIDKPSRDGSDGGRRSTMDDMKLGRCGADDLQSRSNFQLGVSLQRTCIDDEAPGDITSFRPSPLPCVVERASLPVMMNHSRLTPARASDAAGSVLSEPFMYNAISHEPVHADQVRDGIDQPDRRSTASRSTRPVSRNTLIFRGLRLKCAVDNGPVKASLEPATGRMQYFGRTLNRASRIASVTKTGQVWCTQEVWDVASLTVNSFHLSSLDKVERTRPSGCGRDSEASARPSDTTASGREGALMVAGVQLGPCKLRGIQDSVLLVQCRYDDSSVLHVAGKPHAGPPPSSSRQLGGQASSVRRHSSGLSARATPHGLSSRDFIDTSLFGRLNHPSAPTPGQSLGLLALSMPRSMDALIPPSNERTSRMDRVSSMDRIDEICAPHVSLSVGRSPVGGGSGRLLVRRTTSAKSTGHHRATSDSITPPPSAPEVYDADE